MNIKKTVNKFLDQIHAASEQNPDIISFDIEDSICLKTIKKFKLEKILNDISPPDIQWQDLFSEKYKIDDKTKIEMLKNLKKLYGEAGINLDFS